MTDPQHNPVRPRRRARHALTTTAVIAVAALGALLGFAGPAAAAGPSITVSPSSGLTNGQNVTVKGSGFTANYANMVVVQCAASATGASGCNVNDVKFTKADANGAFTVTLTIKEKFGSTDCSKVECIVQGHEGFSDTSGKTGTSSSFRDAWFDGFTGNYVGIVWYGNDNFTPMRRMTGGALPAMTWKRFMTYAHTGIELKPIPYVEPEKPAEVVADAKNAEPQDPGDASALAAQAAGPSNLSVATTQWLNSLQSLLENTARLKPVADLHPASPVTMVAGEAAPAASAIADPQ